MALNAKKIKAPQNKGPRVQQEEIPVGNYMCRVAQVIDLGIRPREKWDTTTNAYVVDTEKAPCQVMMVTYEFLTEFVKDENGVDQEDKPRWLSETLNLFSLEVDLATSTKRYKSIDPTIEQEGDWTKLVGAPCMVTVVHKKNGKAKIGSVSPSIKGVPFPEIKNAPKVFLMDEPDMEIFGSLPDWLREKITTATNFAGSPLDVALNGVKEEQAQPEEAATDTETPDKESFDDDMPW